MTIAAELARRIGAISFADLPPEAVAWAKVGILDTVGVTLAGAARSCARIVVRGARRMRPDPALLFGTDRRVAPLDAALINGTAAHALDFDDCNNTHGRASLGAGAAGAVRAGRRRARSQRREFIAAYVAGFETETQHRPRRQLPSLREGLASDGDARRVRRGRGLLPACSGSMRRARPSRSALAASLASGIKANFGTMTKPLHVGHAPATGCMRRCWRRRLHRQARTRSSTSRASSMVFNGAGNFDAASRARATGASRCDILKPGHRHQAVSLLRQHASRHRCDAGAGASEQSSRPSDGGAGRFLDPSAPPRAHQPARPARARSTPSSACSTASPARCCTAASARALRGRRLQGCGRARAAAAHPRRPASRNEHGQHRPFRRRGAHRDARRPAADCQGRPPARPRPGEAAAPAATGGQVPRLRRPRPGAAPPPSAPCRRSTGSTGWQT